MILVCPSCDAKFKIPDGAIPAAGRTVRCAKCKNSWHAKPVDVMRKKAARVAARPAARRVAPVAPVKVAAVKHENFDGHVDPSAAAEAEALRRSVRTIVDEPVEAAPPPEDDLFEDGDGDAKPVSSSFDEDEFGIKAAARKVLGDDFDEDSAFSGVDDEEDYDEDDFVTRRRADQRRQSERDAKGRRARMMNIGWGGLILFWMMTFYGFVFEKERLLHMFPGTQTFYAMFEGVSDIERFRPAPGEKLTPSNAHAEVYITAKLDNIRTRVEQVDGENRLMVRGFVENLGTTGANVPKVLVEIIDKNNRVLDTWVTEPVGLIIRRRGKVNFETTRAVPAGIASVRVSVIEGSKSTTEGKFPG